MPNYIAIKKVAKPNAEQAKIGEVFEMTEEQAIPRVGLVKLFEEPLVDEEPKKEPLVDEEPPAKKKISLKKKKSRK